MAESQKKLDSSAIRKKEEKDTKKGRKCSPLYTTSLAACARVFIYLWLILSACGGKNSVSPSPSLPANVPTEASFLTLPVVSTPTPTCNDRLVFLEDVTIPDNSTVAAGSRLDKQWLVLNAGSCNWDSRYRLRLINGDAMRASLEQALFPARAGMQATLRMEFTAPLEPGKYISEWQAFDARGIAFGESFFIKVIVE